MAEFDEVWKRVIVPTPMESAPPEMMVDAETGKLVPRWRPGLSYGRLSGERTIEDVRKRIAAMERPVAPHAPWSITDGWSEIYGMNPDVPGLQKLLLSESELKGKFWRALAKVLGRVDKKKEEKKEEKKK